MMPRYARIPAFAAVVLLHMGQWGAGCAPANTPTADPEAQRLDPPVVIIDEPEPESEPLTQAEEAVAPTTLANDPDTEVITFVGADAPPAMADEIIADPKRDPLPSMMSDVIHGPNK